MKYTCYLLRIIFVLLLPAVFNCYPVTNNDIESKSGLNNEKSYPNGTVIGKYNYVDKDGNPIQVKYYADASSYGVELKSIKLLLPNSVPSAVVQPKQPKPQYLLQNTESSIDSTADLSGTKYPDTISKYKTADDTYDHLNKDRDKVNNYRANLKTKPDYFYMKDEFKEPKQCGKENIRIYFDKSKIRNSFKYVPSNKYDVKYCDRF